MFSKGGHYNYSGFSINPVENMPLCSLQKETIARLNRMVTADFKSQPIEEPRPGTYHATVIINGDLYYI
jgi:hypothetical protein